MRAFLRRMTGTGQREDAVHIDGLLSTTDFKEVLQKERARTDRGGPGFSMLALAIDAPVDSAPFRETAWILASLLLERTRFIDTKGWYGEQVAVIFPQTPAARIQNIWPPIKEALDKRLESASSEHIRLPEIRCEVFAYPCEGERSALDADD